MSMIDLLTMPGLDNTKRLTKMRKECAARMETSIANQALGVAVMGLRKEQRKKKSLQ